MKEKWQKAVIRYKKRDTVLEPGSWVTGTKRLIAELNGVCWSDSENKVFNSNMNKTPKSTKNPNP